MIQAHSMLEDYRYNPHSGGRGHEGIYAKPVYNLSRLCHSNPQLSPPEELHQGEDGLSHLVHENHPASSHQGLYPSPPCGTPYRYTSLTIPVMPPKKFRSEQAEILRCKRRVDLSHKLGYKSHPTAVARRNERERNRVKHINSTFATLRHHIPCAAKNKKMSKVETLRSAIRYINHLQHILDSQSSGSDGLDSLEGSSRLTSQSEGLTQAISSTPGSQRNSQSNTSLQERSHPGSTAILSPPATPESDNTCSTPGSDDPRDGYYGNHLEEDVDGMDEEDVEDGEEVSSLSQFADWF